MRGNVEEAVKPLRDALTRFEEVSAAMGEPDADFDALLAEQGELMEVIEQHDGWELDARIEQAMDALRCPPGDADVTVLSGGERRRVALCRLLLEAPDLLLLDEPTNHLDAESVAWLEQHLEKYAGTVVAVTHDRYFLDNVAQWILELDRGRAYPYEGNYSTYLETKSPACRSRGPRTPSAPKRLKDELEWVRSGAKARQAKSKARLARYEEMAAEADKFRKLDFEEIQIPPGPRLGSVVVETKKLTKGFGDRVLIDDLSFTLPRNGIVGVVGPNGAGKTTLFKMLVGRGEARRRRDQGRRDGQARPTSSRTAAASTRRRRCGTSSPTASTTSRSATSRCRRGPTSRPSASRARTSRSRPASCPVASGTGSTSR